MKKLTIIALVFCLVLAFGLVGCKDDSKTTKQTTTSEGSTNNGGSNTVPKTWDLSNLYGSSGSYKCIARIVTAQGSANMEIWIKGNKERIETTSTEGTAVTIFDGKTMYSWAKGQNQGVMMDMEDIADLSGQTQAQTETKSVEDWNKDAVDVTCNEESISDSLLTPPSNVNFMDMGEMLANLQNMPSM